jgi:hypothetical protein
MKLYSSLVLFIFFSYISKSSACDVCSGVSNGFNLDISGQQTTNSVGIGYRYIPFKTLNENTSNLSMINMVDVYGSYSPVKNFVIISSISYIHSIIKEQESRQTFSGLGDMSLLFNYKALSKIPEKNSNIKHELSFVAGLELPTGKYINDVDNLPLQQTGSRSVDFLSGVNYQVSLGDWWISNSNILKINTTNKFEYRFGNSYWSAIYAAYSIKKTKHLIRPMVGMDVLHQQRNVKENIYQNMTGGTLIRSVAGLGYKINDFQISFLTQIPIYQDMNNTSIKFLPDLTLKLFYNL